MTSKTTTLTGEGVPLDPEAVDQLHRVAASDDCMVAVGMPDLHAGPGIPIGACFACRSVHPLLVGGDAGCGARVTIAKCKFEGDALERRVRDAFERNSEEEFAEFSEGAWALGMGSLLGVAEGSLANFAARYVAKKNDSVSIAPPGPLGGLGTIGGGNHFAEVSRIGKVVDGSRAMSLRIGRDSVAIVVHSGSRSVGAGLHHHWASRGLLESLRADDTLMYLEQLRGAVQFAEVNRLLITWRLLQAIGATRDSSIHSSFDVVHNDVAPITHDGESLWLHRKGCAPANTDQLTVVLGSRGTESWIMNGLGNTALLNSVAHGAGRRLTRTAAYARFKETEKREHLRRTPLGGRVICDEPKLLFEEHPEAYKPIEPVIRVLEAHQLATRVCSLVPMITVKK